MKQLPMTPALSEMIKKAVGPDVETADLAVFETKALNTNPLPGKDGTIFEKAVVKPVTLSQMVDWVNSGKTLPLVSDHELFGAPKGKVFHAGLNYDESVGLDSLELRLLFYLDQTEQAMITKLNSASLDEVSVSFLSSAFLCSECGWDYFAFGTPENIDTRTCANGHTIGEDGVHAEMVGLNQFLETSLVARGAADNPKIVGKSESLLAPENTYRLAAQGFEPHALVVRASMGSKEEVNMSDTLVTNLSGQVATLTGEKAVAESNVTRLTTELSTASETIKARDTRIGELETELTAAKAAKPEDYDTSKTQLSEAVTFLQTQLNHLRVAKGEAKLEGESLPSKPAELQAQISELTGNLTSIIPVGGVSANSVKTQEEANLSINRDAYSVRKL